MIDRKEIDLLVRAQLKGKGDLAAVTKSIGELEKALESQAAAAKRGESSIDELKATLLGLQQVQERLKSQADLIGTFQRMGEQITKTTERVTKSGEAYEKYRAKLAETAEVTDKQQERLIRLSTAYERSQATLNRQQTQYAQLAESLREAGIATDQLAAAELRVRDSAAQIGIAISKAQTAIGEYADDVRRSRNELQQKEQAEREATKTAEQFAAAERRAAEAARQRAEDAERVAQSIADRNARIAAEGRQFSDQSREAARARELAELKADIIARSEQQLRVEKELARNSTLTKAADDAQKAAQSYSSLARAADDLRPKTTSLRDVIASITNPAEASRKSLEGVEKEIESLSRSIKSISGPVKDYRGQLAQLAEASRAISGQASLVDDFRKQADALRQARTEFTAARVKVNEYAAAVRQGGDAGEAFTGKLAEATAKARQTAAALQAQLQATRASRDALRAAGIDTNNLAAAQTRLTNAAKSAVSSIHGLKAAVDQYGTAVEKTGNKVKGFHDGERTTLSLYQRIRGEVLALTASYVGLQGAIGLAGDSMNAVNTRQSVRNQLSISVGNDKAAIDAEYEYVKAQSDRIGLEFDRAAKGYAKFSAAASMAGRSRQEIRYIWESFAEVGRVANISADDLDGVFRALEQVTSKGKIQAEELRGQIGDRLFGAFQVAADALKDTYPDLNKAMENGQVTSDQLVKIAEKYRSIVADQLPEAVNSLGASQARLNTAIFDFKLALADAGWTDTYTKLIKDFTTFLQSDDGKQAAKFLSEGFQAVGESLIWVLKNLETVKVVAEAAGVALLVSFGARAVNNFVTVGKNIGSVVDKLKVAGGAVSEFAAKWPKLTKVVTYAFGAMAAGMLGWEIGKWANEEFEVVRKAGVWLVTGLDEVWTRIKYGAKILWEEFPRYAKNGFIGAINAVSWGTREILTIMQKGLQAMGQDQLAANVGRVVDNLTLKYEQQGDRVGELKAQMEKDIAAIKNIRMDMLKDAERRDAQKSVSPSGTTAPKAGQTPFPGVTPGKGKPGATDAEISRRQNEVESIRRSLESLDAKIDRSQTETLSAQLNAVDLEYAKLARRIGALGGEASAEFMKHLNDSTAVLKTQLTAKFNQGLLDEQESLQNKLEDIEAAAGKRSKFSLDARLAGVRKQYEDTYRQIEEFRVKLEANGRDTAPADLARGRLDAGIAELQNLERVKFATEELNRLEQGTNDLLSLRDQMLAVILQKKEAGAMTDEEAARELNRIQLEAIPGIQMAADATIQWAAAHSAIFANPEQMEIFIAKMEAVRAKASQAKTEFTDWQKFVGGKGADAINQGLDSVWTGLEQIATGQKTVAQGFRDIAASTLGIFAQFLKDIALAILKLMIFNAMKNSGNPFVSAIGTAGAASVNVKHAGGVVGHTSRRNRTVASALFDYAPRYHTGGVAGLAPNEYATILKKNEEVLTEDSPRNILNGGAGIGGAGGQGGRPQDVSIQNYVDAQSFLSAAAATSAGRKVIMNVLSAERAQLRTLVGR